jgi:putative ABC transport system permease protein
MRDLNLDIRYALRALRASPTSTVSALATLALGIAMSTSIFSVVRGVVLRPLPFPNDDRLITICERYPGSTRDWCGIAPPNVEDIAARSRTIDAIGIARQWPYHIETTRGAESIDGGLASPGMFAALGARAELGRLIEPADLIGRQSTVAVLTHETWQARFGGRRDILGQVIALDKDAVTIVGVLSPGFEVPRIGTVDLWRPLHVNPKDEQHREWRGFVSFGRLRPGVSLGTARAELATLAGQIRAAHFATTAGWDLQLTTTRDLVVGGVRSMLYLFLASVLAVLLIGCANIANLMLARANARTREVALRAALGASPARIVRGLLVESLLLAFTGGALGVALAVAATRAFKALAPVSIPRVAEVGIDSRVLLFAVTITIATTLVFGLVPALRGAHVDLKKAMSEAGRGASASRGRLGGALVVGELALAVVLVASAGLLVRSFVALTSWRPGFEQRHVLTFTIFATNAKYSTSASVAGLLKRLEDEIAAVPGVSNVATASGGPLFGGRETWEMDVQQPAALPRASVRWYDASPSFFPTLGVPIVRGRGLNETDAANDPLVGVVNETLARRFWPEGDPIGKTLTFTNGADRAVFRVVGVVTDIPSLNPDDPIEPQLFWSNRQLPRPYSYVIVRTALEPVALTSAIATRVKAVDRDLEANNIRTLPERMQRELVTPRFIMLLASAFGIAALFFAGVGTFGLLSYLVSQRTREIGIRYALGAQRRDVIAAVVGRGVALAALGAAIGINVTIVAGRAIRALVVGVSVSDAPTLAAAALTLLGVAVAACLVPALRASRVNPVIALNSE